MNTKFSQLPMPFLLFLIISAVSLGSARSSLGAPGETILRIHGSNTIGAKLGPELVKRYLKHNGYSTITQEAGAKENEYFIVAAKGDKIVNIELQAHGSSTSFKSLEAGLCDVGMSSRRTKDKELKKLEFLGDMSSVRNEHVLAIDGIAVIVHRANAISSLDVETIHKIFTGKITNWKKLGGEDAAIQVYSRDAKSGTYDTFKSMVLKKVPLIASAKRHESNADLSDDVSRDTHGIGFVGMPYVRNSKALMVKKAKDSRGYLPTSFTAAYEEYPLSRRLYLYTADTPQNPLAKDFAEFSLSSLGQKSVALLGFAKLSMDMEERNINADFFTNEIQQNRYTFETLGGRRVNFNFRFSNENSELENRSQKDLERFISFIQERDQYYYEPLLIGINSCQQTEIMLDTISEKVGLENFHVPPKMLCLDNVADRSGRPVESLVEVWLRVVDDGA